MNTSLSELLDLPAPAKINLFLHITGRRKDGYHLIQSVFQMIDWCDAISLTLRSDGIISRSDDSCSSIALPPDDLCVRAAQALQQAAGCKLGAHIALKKQIPAQAGLGGGSSDAATCLIGLNKLWALDLPRSTLERIGLALGADLPFFLRGQSAWVSGIGEQIQPLPTGMMPSGQTIAVIKPENGLSTPAIFRHPALRRDSSHATINEFALQPYVFGRNDLQAVGEMIEPQVHQALEIFRKMGLSARMTGSGSAVFAACPSDFQLDKQHIPTRWQQKLCKTLDIHPLKDWVEDGV